MSDPTKKELAEFASAIDRYYRGVATEIRSLLKGKHLRGCRAWIQSEEVECVCGWEQVKALREEVKP